MMKLKRVRPIIFDFTQYKLNQSLNNNFLI